MSNSTILVTGASGHLGRRVLELLIEAGAPAHRKVVATTRTPDKLADFQRRGIEVRSADFDDEASLSRAFAGVGRALLISTDQIDTSGGRIAQQQRAVRALAAAGAKHVVYTSLTNAPASKVAIAPDHAATEQALAESGLGYTALRNNMYMDLMLATLPGAIATGQLVDARGNGKVAYVTRDDCARVAAKVLSDDARTGREVLDVTGPSALGSEAVAALVSEITGKPVRHISVPVAAVAQGMIQHGVPEVYARAIATFDTAIAGGELGIASDTVERVTGRKPTSLADFLRGHRAQLTAA